MGRFCRLCQEHRDRIYTFAFYYMGNREDAEDITQEVLFRLWRHGLRMDDKGVAAWLQGGRVNVGFFADAGSAWLADGADFDLQVSGGLGLHRDDFRLYIARPVSNQTRDLDLSLRFSRTF